MVRCVVTVLGMADRVKGTSKKTGKPYDMIECAFGFRNQWGNNSVACAIINGEEFDRLGVQAGGKYDAVVNTYDGKTDISLIDEVY